MTELMAAALFDKITAKGIPLHHQPYAVNIGCWDGREFNDPVYPLYKDRGFCGVAIDGRDVPLLSQNLSGLPVELITKTFVYPENIVSILRRAKCPPNFEFLKMDIDGYDGPVTRAILGAGMRPLVIQMELNSEIPPPIAFSVSSHKSYIPGGHTGFFGCSLSYASHMLFPYGYVLIELDFNTEFTHDALFVDFSMLSWGLGISPLEPRKAFLGQRPLLPHLNCVQSELRLRWRTMDDISALYDEIYNALSSANRDKHQGKQLPFELFVA